MALRTWGAGSVMDGNWGTATCWTGDTKPQAGDDVVFDNTDDTNCIMDEAPAALGSMDVQAGYDGDIDFNDKAFSCGDMTFDGTGQIDCGNGGATITCSGHFDNLHQGSFLLFPVDYTIDLTGASKNLTLGSSLQKVTITGSVTYTGSAYAKGCATLTVDGTFIQDATNAMRVPTVTVNNGGTLTINSGKEILAITSGTFTNNTGGTINGSGTLRLAAGGTIDNDGSWSADGNLTTKLQETCTIAAGTYGGTFLCENDDASNPEELTFGGNVIFQGPVTFDADTGQTYTIDQDTNNPDVEFQGDVTLNESGGGTLSWSKGTGTNTFGATSGTQVYTDTTAAIQNLGDVDHDGAGGTLQLATEMECDDFAGIAGTLDLNGQTLDPTGAMDWALGYLFADPVGGTFSPAGNFTANANDLSGATGTWYLSVGGTAVASGVGAVAHCDASGGTEIDASSGPWTDSGNNDNWNFGAAVSIAHRLTPVPGADTWKISV